MHIYTLKNVALQNVGLIDVNFKLKATKKNNTMLCSEITPRKIQKLHPTPRRGNSHQTHSFCRFTADSPENLQKTCAHRESLHPEIRQYPRILHVLPLSKNPHHTGTSQLKYETH